MGNHVIKAIKINHLNMVLEDYDAAVAHFTQKYGGEFMFTVPTQDARAGLFEIGHVIYELFAPKAWLLNSRYGAHYLGIEFQVASLEEGRKVLAEHNIRVARELGVAVHSHPADFHGTSLELYEDEFHEREYDELPNRKIRPASFWANEHPLALTGLKAVTWAVRDIAPVRAGLEAMFGATLAYEAERPQVAARSVGLAIADTVFELVEPTGPGIIADHLVRWGEGIRTSVLGSRDMAAVKKWCQDHDLPLEPGTAEGWLAVPAQANHGVIIEFAPA